MDGDEADGAEDTDRADCHFDISFGTVGEEFFVDADVSCNSLAFCNVSTCIAKQSAAAPAESAGYSSDEPQPQPQPEPEPRRSRSRSRSPGAGARRTLLVISRSFLRDSLVVAGSPDRHKDQ